MNDAETIEQIAAKRAGVQQGLNLQVRGRYDPDIDRSFLTGAHGPNHSLLQHAEQLHLKDRRRFTDLIQKDRAS
jgi:hypothetical protein